MSFICNFNMTSFISYINNTVIKLPIFFNLHMHIDEQIINIIPNVITLFSLHFYENNVTHVKTGFKLWLP